MDLCVYLDICNCVAVYEQPTCMHYVNCWYYFHLVLFAKIVFSGFMWHHMWRNVRIELSKDHMEASCYKGSSGNHWATFAGKKQF